MRGREAKFLTRALMTLGGSALATLAGVIALQPVFGEALARLSYDLPFLLRPPRSTEGVKLIYLDEDSARKLNQPLDGVWDRALHAQLLDRLSQEGARLAFFDIVFDASGPDPATDERLAEAIARNGHVVLGAALETLQPVGGVSQERVLAPIRSLRKAAAAWGLLTFRPIDVDYAVRQIFAGTPQIPSATWQAAMALGAPLAAETRAVPRYVNYYGPPNEFQAVSFAQVIQPQGLPDGYFQNQIVLVGGRAAVGYLGTSRDQFATPYSRGRAEFATGLEVHATVLLNLLRGEWLTRLTAGREFLLVVAIGVLLGGLALLRPLFATATAIAGTLLLLALIWWMFSSAGVWWNWVVPVAVQVPVGLTWSLGSQYYLEARRRKALRRAFGFYLSPEMADRISNSDFDLTPGGRTVECSVMFTDLENFTTLSEDLAPAEVSRTLIAYFERTTACILERKGTIIKYVGDAVMAGWGAPLDNPEHASFAAEAACDLRSFTEMDVRGLKLRTRVGVSTGQVLAGNLGSSFRFDYTMIGDTTNFASRLEALNKVLGTQVLLSDRTRQALPERFVTRSLGEFRVAGKTHSVRIHELICREAEVAKERSWMGEFEEALGLVRAGRFAEARRCFAEVEKLRGGTDGPSRFYLKTMAELERAGLLSGWNGVVEMHSK